MAEFEQSHQQLQTYWENRARTATTDCERVEWSLRAQRMRFEAFIVHHALAGCSILDVGCGLADLWAHLQKRGVACEYVGIDISTEMIARCRERYPALRFEATTILDWNPGRMFDFTVAFGIHNIRVDGNRALVERVTRRQFELCRVAAHVSLLSDRFKGTFAPHIQAHAAEEVLRDSLGISPFVVLRHDYLPNDFSVTLYREPLIDTRRDLVLE